MPAQRIQAGIGASQSEPFDLLVANILADVLIGLGETFASVVRPGGLYIASGIIEERETDVRFFCRGRRLFAAGDKANGRTGWRLFSGGPKRRND